ncbi:hypothetical protein QFC21_006792 [Naganishia friedmannii]|uniref:Uncharacterized protein n=1 Tax=Naganishia friedmannii TaxID=89922 RepID=A0ACC2V1M1_9TREE|nr:hypothetical protein QFC21_006792 [Naganishia friedmannii]
MHGASKPQFGGDHSTFRGQLPELAKPLPRKYTRYGTNKRFKDGQEVSLILYMKNLEAVGGSVSVQKLETLANRMPHNVTEYFDRLQGQMIKYGIEDTDLWNMDKAGFRIGMGGNRKIITSASQRQSKHYLASEMDRES